MEAKWVELTKVDTWRRESYIKESGFATPPGATSPNLAVADACADALSKINRHAGTGREVDIRVVGRSEEDRQMWLYIQTWLSILSISLTATICFGVASFVMGQEKSGTGHF